MDLSPKTVYKSSTSTGEDARHQQSLQNAHLGPNETAFQTQEVATAEPNKKNQKIISVAEDGESLHPCAPLVGDTVLPLLWKTKTPQKIKSRITK